MKTSERRNRIVLLYIVLILGFFALSRVSRAEEAPSLQAPPSAETPSGGHH